MFSVEGDSFFRAVGVVLKSQGTLHIAVEPWWKLTAPGEDGDMVSYSSVDKIVKQLGGTVDIGVKNTAPRYAF